MADAVVPGADSCQSIVGSGEELVMVRLRRVVMEVLELPLKTRTKKMIPLPLPLLLLHHYQQTQQRRLLDWDNLVYGLGEKGCSDDRDVGVFPEGEGHP